MKKIKPLSPSLREKKRYIAFEIVSEKDLSFKQVSETITSVILKFSGITGLAEAGLIILKEKFNKNKCVLRISTKCVDKVRASFCLTDKSMILRTLGVSGMLNKMDKYLG